MEHNQEIYTTQIALVRFFREMLQNISDQMDANTISLLRSFYPLMKAHIARSGIIGSRLEAVFQLLNEHCSAKSKQKNKKSPVFKGSDDELLNFINNKVTALRKQDIQIYQITKPIVGTIEIENQVTKELKNNIDALIAWEQELNSSKSVTAQEPEEVLTSDYLLAQLKSHFEKIFLLPGQKEILSRHFKNQQVIAQKVVQAGIDDSKVINISYYNLEDVVEDLEESLEELERYLVHFEAAILLKQHETFEVNLSRRMEFGEKMAQSLEQLEEIVWSGNFYLIQMAAFLMKEVGIKMSRSDDEDMVKNALDMMFRGVEGIRQRIKKDLYGDDFNSSVFIFGGLDTAMLMEMGRFIHDLGGFHTNISPLTLELMLSQDVLFLTDEGPLSKQIFDVLSMEGLFAEIVENGRELKEKVGANKPFAVIATDKRLLEEWDSYSPFLNEFYGKFILLETGVQRIFPLERLGPYLDSVFHAGINPVELIEELNRVKSNLNRALLKLNNNTD